MTDVLRGVYAWLIVHIFIVLSCACCVNVLLCMRCTCGLMLYITVLLWGSLDLCIVQLLLLLVVHCV